MARQAQTEVAARRRDRRDEILKYFYSLQRPEQFFKPGNIVAVDEDGNQIFSIDPTKINHIRGIEDQLARFGYPLIRVHPSEESQVVVYKHPEEGFPTIHRGVLPAMASFVDDLLSANETLPDATPAAIPTPTRTTTATTIDQYSSSSSSDADMSSAPKKPAKQLASRPSTTLTKRANAADKMLDDPKAVLENEKSPIYSEDLNLKAVLMHPKAQETLRKAGIDLSKLSSEELASAIAQFKEDGRSGRHDPAWVAQANEASQVRSAGGFAEYEKAKFKEDWGEELPETEGKASGSGKGAGVDKDTDDLA